MVLKYNFEYTSNNNTLIKYLNNFFQNQNLEYFINKTNETIELFIKANEEELIEVSTQLGNALPMSIYLKNYSVDVVKEEEIKSNEQTCFETNLPFCLSCLQKVEDENSNSYYNPFITCQTCNTTKEVSNLIYDNKNFEDYKEMFEIIASDISLGKKVKIKTLSGDFVFYKKDKIEENDDLLCVNIAEINSFVNPSKEETVALVSLEKPRIKLKVNEQYKIIKAIDTKEVYLRYANDLVLYLLGLELAKLNVPFIAYEKDIEFDKELNYEKESLFVDIPTISINENRTFIINSSSYDEKLDELYSKVSQKHKAQFTTILHENSLFEKSILNLFISKTSSDNVSLYSPKIDGMIDILNFEIPSSMQEIFDEISSSDTGKRLINNYQNKYPQFFENAQNFDTSSIKNASIFSLFKLAELVLGLDDIYKNANESLLDKGPRIDFKLKKQDKLFNKQFNLARFIQSGMSFKLAGVDDNTLSLGYLESYTYFLANLIDDVNNEFELDGISLCGDMLISSKYYSLLKKAITKNYKMYYNKDFLIQK